jgi:hypothetical protein
MIDYDSALAYSKDRKCPFSLKQQIASLEEDTVDHFIDRYKGRSKDDLLYIYRGLAASYDYVSQQLHSQWRWVSEEDAFMAPVRLAHKRRELNAIDTLLREENRKEYVVWKEEYDAIKQRILEQIPDAWRYACWVINSPFTEEEHGRIDAFLKEVPPVLVTDVTPRQNVQGTRDTRHKKVFSSCIAPTGCITQALEEKYKDVFLWYFILDKRESLLDCRCLCEGLSDETTCFPAVGFRPVYPLVAERYLFSDIARKDVLRDTWEPERF